MHFSATYDILLVPQERGEILEKAKRGRPSNIPREFTLRVRLSDEELSMLDNLCTIKEKTRSQMIRYLLVEAIHGDHFDFEKYQDLKQHLRNLREQLDILEILEDNDSLIDEIDNAKIDD